MFSAARKKKSASPFNPFLGPELAASRTLLLSKKVPGVGRSPPSRNEQLPMPGTIICETVVSAIAFSPPRYQADGFVDST